MADGELYYRCFWDGVIIHFREQLSTSEHFDCHHCKRRIAYDLNAEDDGIMTAKVRQMRQVQLEADGPWFDLPAN